jgi:hypothetical protein
MKGHLFLVVLNPIEAEQRLTRLQSLGWQVDMESDDHGRAYDFVIRNRPDVLAIYLDQQPSAARKVGRSVRAEKGFENLPIVFVGGDSTERELARAEIKGAVFTQDHDLPRILEQFAQ